jgi:hypothetical protein
MIEDELDDVKHSVIDSKNQIHDGKEHKKDEIVPKTRKSPRKRKLKKEMNKDDDENEVEFSNLELNEENDDHLESIKRSENKYL